MNEPRILASAEATVVNDHGYGAETHRVTVEQDILGPRLYKPQLYIHSGYGRDNVAFDIADLDTVLWLLQDVKTQLASTSAATTPV